MKRVICLVTLLILSVGVGPRSGTDILRACNRSGNDDCCLNGSPYDAACWDANVQAYD